MLYITTGDELKSVADAIRAKGLTVDLLEYPDSFVSAIEALRLTFLPVLSMEQVEYASGSATSTTGKRTITKTATLDKKNMYLVVFHDGPSSSSTKSEYRYVFFWNGTAWEFGSSSETDNFDLSVGSDDVLTMKLIVNISYTANARLINIGQIWEVEDDGSTEG